MYYSMYYRHSYWCFFISPAISVISLIEKFHLEWASASLRTPALLQFICNVFCTESDLWWIGLDFRLHTKKAVSCYVRVLWFCVIGDLHSMAVPYKVLTPYKERPSLIANLEQHSPLSSFSFFEFCTTNQQLSCLFVYTTVCTPLDWVFCLFFDFQNQENIRYLANGFHMSVCVYFLPNSGDKQNRSCLCPYLSS